MKQTSKYTPYCIIENKKAGDKWFLKNQFVSADSVPEGEKKLFRGECLFCLEKGSHTRLLKQRLLLVCNEHYFQTTLGKVAQQARELGL